MSFTTHNTFIETLFLSSFPGLQPDVDIAVENDNFASGTNNWIRFTIRNADTDQFALGSVNSRTIGIVYFQIYIQAGKGIAAARGIANSISSIFRGVVDNGVRYGIPEFMAKDGIKGDIGKLDGWHQSIVTVSFSFEEFD